MFVDGIFNLIGIDPGRQLAQFSERWFKRDMEDGTGFPSALAKLQSGSAIADWFGFTWNLERPFDGRHRLMAHLDATAKEGASGKHHGLGAVHTAEVGADSCDSRLSGLFWIPIYFQAGHHCFAQGQVGGVMQQLQHLP